MNGEERLRTDRWPRVAFAAALLLGVVANLATVATFPSWFDEAFFANITFNLLNARGFAADLSPGFAASQVLWYGPVFFWIEALIADGVGLSAFGFRVPALLAGYAIAALLAIFMRRRGAGSWRATLVAACIAADVSVNRGMVSGRMDLLALFFVASAMVLATVDRSERAIWRALGVGAAIGGACALAYLTTPRALFLMPAAACAAWPRWDSLRSRAGLALAIAAILAFSVPVGAWVAYAGGPGRYMEMFTSNPATAGLIGPSFLRSVYDNVAILLMLAFLAYRWRVAVATPFVVGAFAAYVLFSTFVREAGPYASMIMPLVLLVVIGLLPQTPSTRSLRTGVAVLLIAPGTLLLFARGVDAIANAGCRDGRAIMEFVQPARSVLAPFKYYFLLAGPNRKVETWEYASVDIPQLVARAQVVVGDTSVAAKAQEAGLHFGVRLACEPKRIWPLPESFYLRSTFRETLLFRPL